MASRNPSLPNGWPSIRSDTWRHDGGHESRLSRHCLVPGHPLFRHGEILSKWQVGTHLCPMAGQVSDLILGGMMAAMSPDYLDIAWSLGIRYFDTAKSYLNGKSEPIFAQWLAKYPI